MTDEVQENTAFLPPLKRGPGRPPKIRDEPIPDPEAVKESERTAADMARATERLAEEQVKIARIAAEDAVKIAAEVAKKEAEAKASAERERVAQEVVLNTPLTEQEEMELASLEAAARSGRSCSRESMLTLNAYFKRVANLAKKAVK
jgi:hypothetical protein